MKRERLEKGWRRSWVGNFPAPEKSSNNLLFEKNLKKKKGLFSFFFLEKGYKKIEKCYIIVFRLWFLSLQQTKRSFFSFFFLWVGNSGMSKRTLAGLPVKLLKEYYDVADAHFPRKKFFLEIFFFFVFIFGNFWGCFFLFLFLYYTIRADRNKEGGLSLILYWVKSFFEETRWQWNGFICP